MFEFVTPVLLSLTPNTRSGIGVGDMVYRIETLYTVYRIENVDMKFFYTDTDTVFLVY